MNKFQAKKIAKQRKFKLNDGNRFEYATQDDLISICGFSRSHAYKIIKGEYSLTNAHLELLKIKILGSIPDWPAGWYFENGEIVTPRGYKINDVMLSQYEFFISIMKDLERDMRKLTRENKALRDKEKQRSEIRVYVNDGKEPERTIKLVKG